jgi:hypothetical protein
MEPHGMLLSHRNVLEKCFLSHGHTELLLTEEAEKEIGVCWWKIFGNSFEF